MKKFQRVISGTILSVMMIIIATCVPVEKYISEDIMNANDIRLIFYLIAFMIPGSQVFRNAVDDVIRNKLKAFDFYATIISVLLFLFVNEIVAVAVITIYLYIKTYLKSGTS